MLHFFKVTLPKSIYKKSQIKTNLERFGYEIIVTTFEEKVFTLDQSILLCLKKLFYSYFVKQMIT